jgi:hypothetical protein
MWLRGLFSGEIFNLKRSDFDFDRGVHPRSKDQDQAEPSRANERSSKDSFLKQRRSSEFFFTSEKLSGVSLI